MDKDRADSLKDPDGTTDDSGGKLLSEDLVKAIQEAMRDEIAKVVPAPSHPPVPLGSSASGTNLFSLHALFILACVRGGSGGSPQAPPTSVVISQTHARSLAPSLLLLVSSSRLAV